MPTALARGPWGGALAGNYIGGLLSRAIESVAVTHGMQPSRLTVDLMRPVGLRPVTVRTSVARDGRKLVLVDAVMLQDDKAVARARALYLKPDEPATEAAWSTPITMPPIPVECNGCREVFRW